MNGPTSDMYLRRVLDEHKRSHAAKVSSETNGVGRGLHVFLRGIHLTHATTFYAAAFSSIASRTLSRTGRV